MSENKQELTSNKIVGETLILLNFVEEWLEKDAYTEQISPLENEHKII